MSALSSDSQSAAAHLRAPSTASSVPKAIESFPTVEVFKEADRFTMTPALAKITKQYNIECAVGPHDDARWGAGESERTLREALDLARSAAWQDWSDAARANRWHRAGHSEASL
jgi:hypothetical protein